MTDKESKPDKAKSMYILPGLLAVILAAVLTATGWAAIEYMSSYKEFVKAEIRITDLSEKLKQANFELRQSKEINLSLRREVDNANENIRIMTEELSIIKENKEALSRINQKYSEQKQNNEELKRMVSKLQSDKVATDKKLSSATATINAQQQWIDKQKLTLDSCINRPDNVEEIGKLKKVWDLYLGEYYILPPDTKSFYNGKGWIQVVSIGRDGHGNFAIASSSVFSDPSDRFCIRPYDAFMIDSDHYLVITSITDSIVINDNYIKK